MRKLTFSFSSIFMVVTIVALFLSVITTRRREIEAANGLTFLEADYGIVERIDLQKTYVRHFVNPDFGIAAVPSLSPECFRFVPASGVSYVLHVTEISGNRTPVTQLMPTKSAPLDSWRPGAVLCCVAVPENGCVRAVVSAESRLVMDYTTGQRWESMQGTEEKMYVLGKQDAFHSDERIPLYSWVSHPTQQGFVLWLEPYDQWNAQPTAVPETDLTDPQ